VRHIRRYWPETHITIRGEHYGRPEVMAFCEAHRVDYVFGLPTNAALRCAAIRSSPLPPMPARSSGPRNSV
jgi:hypothetical protein